MKWARVKEKSSETISNDKQAEQANKNDTACFDDYPDGETLEKELENPKNQWANHEFIYHFAEPICVNYHAFQKRYEMFCGGYLLFYDSIVRRRVVDHTLHFKWSPENENGKYSVKIYISPPPQTPIENYTKICGMDSDEYYRPKTSETVYQGIASATGDEALSVDPPPPPPPPPPTMH